MNTADFVKAVNAERLNNRNRWYFFGASVNGKDVQIKAYGTYLQIFRVDKMTVPTGMEMNVTQFKAALEKGVA